MNLLVQDADHVRTLTLNRPEALNAFDEALYDATANALSDAAGDPEVSVVVITGAGRAFSAGTDLKDLHERVTNPDFAEGERGFIGLVDELAAFPKPLLCAVNGLGVGIGTTILGYADLVFMSSTARLKCPFTSLGVAPEAASSYLLPALIGRQNASWLLLSSEWVTAADALRMGLTWRTCAPDDLMNETLAHAAILASRPLASLQAVKAAVVEPHRAAIAAARNRENGFFATLLGTAANADALSAFGGPGVPSTPAGGH